MHKIVLSIATLILAVSTYAQSEHTQIRKALQGYIHGTAYNDSEQILSSFIPEARLFLDYPDQALYELSVEEYAQRAGQKNVGQYNGRSSNIISIDQYQGIAVAKLEVLIAGLDKRFIDLILLKKLDDGWKIISKTAASEISIKGNEKALIVLSSRRKQGDSDEPCGNSFSEIVQAYDVYSKAGIHVDFVSPKGGAVGLAYVYAYDSLQLEYLYDFDFMYKLKHTLAPHEVVADEYGIIQFTGGSAPVYDIPQNKALQDIAMHIYEKNNGVLAAVCHGSAALVNMKTADGEYLVKGKKVNSYPNAHENMTNAYNQNAPFLIESLLKERGGEYHYGEDRKKGFMITDGRLVTGQNYQSSIMVSEKTIELSRGKKLDEVQRDRTPSSNEGLIEKTLWNYINGRNNGNIDQLKSAFHESAELRYMKKDKEYTIWPISDYIKGTEEGKVQDCESRILWIDQRGSAAIAKIEIEYPGWLFTDYINLLLMDGEWKIVVKTFSGVSIE